ncbi:MAG: heparinase II/III domain-containing protein, partial [Candidatus Latescibacterota bacterium]
LYFSRDDIGRIMAKTGGGHGKTVWEAIRSRAGESRSRNTIEDFRYKFDAFNEEYWIPVFADFGRELRNPQDYIRDNALVYGLSGDTAAGDAARQALLKVSEWPAYVPPHITNQGKHSYYITGLFLTDLALAYDLLYERFSPEERKKAAGALYEKGMKEAYEEYVRNNWVSSHTSNWICDVTAASILCAAAVYGDYGDKALEPYLTGSILKAGELVRAAFDPDGDYGEGSLYYMHTLHGLTKSMAVLERFFDVRFPDKIARSHASLLYQIDPESKRIYSFGDAYENLMLFGPGSYLGMGNAAWLLAKYRDPHLKWLYDMNPGTTERDLIFLDDTIAAKPPADLPKVRHFGEVGTTVFRSGFSRDDFAFIFRCGAYVNHQHFDQGAFFLADRGEEFLGEVGRTDYYADDWDQNIVIQPGGHNCILVNGNPESQRHGDFLHDVPAWKNHASTTDFFPFEGGAFVSGRLDPLYQGKMDSLRRSILYLEPRIVAIIDEASGTPDARTIDLRFHAPFMEDISMDGRDARVTRPGGTLTIRTLSPESFRAEILRRPMTLREIGDRNLRNLKKRGFLQLSATLENESRNAVFVNVLSTDREAMERLEHQILADRAVFTCNGRRYAVKTSAGKRYREGDAETDALVFSFGEDGFLALRATEVTMKGAPAIRADKPISLRWRAGKTVSFSYAAHESVQMMVKGIGKPRQVIHDGKPVKGWTYRAAEGLSVTLPAGKGQIETR